VFGCGKPLRWQDAARGSWAVLLTLLVLSAVQSARAANVDNPAPPVVTEPPPVWSLYEFRAGVFDHGAGLIGPHEYGGADLNLEFLTPRLPFLQDSVVSWLMPRLQVGGMANFAGKTSFAYAGFAWTLSITPRWFIEPLFGGSINNAPNDTMHPNQLDLGCHEMFHTGFTTGYRLTDHWNIMATWEHISNAGLCVKNPGLNDFGLKLGYSF